MTKYLYVIVLSALLVGCGTVYKSTITITQVVDSAMKEWASLSVVHKTSSEIDAKITSAHAKYQVACGVAKRAFITYKNGGDKAAYEQAVETVRQLAFDIVDIIIPMISTEQAIAYNKQLTIASKP